MLIELVLFKFVVVLFDKAYRGKGESYVTPQGNALIYITYISDNAVWLMFASTFRSGRGSCVSVETGIMRVKKMKNTMKSPLAKIAFSLRILVIATLISANSGLQKLGHGYLQRYIR